MMIVNRQNEYRRRLLLVVFESSWLLFLGSCARHSPAQTSPAQSSASTSAPAAPMAKSWPLARGNALAQGVAEGELPEKLDVVWKMTVEKGAFEATPVIADGVAYLGDMDGKVFALSLADGKEVWSRKLESGFIASPAVRGNLVYLGDIDGKFYALDTKSGEPKWTFEAEAEIDNGANFWGENLLFGSQDAHLYCL